MLTWLTMLIQKIEGSNLVLFIMLGMWAIYLVLFFAMKANRSKKAFKTALNAGAVVTEICDIVWFFKFFDNLSYRNPGFGGIAWFCLLPALMFITVMVLSYINASRYEFDKKKREKEKEKQKKEEKRRKQLEKRLAKEGKDLPEE